jgi:hypothetical protein
MFSFYHKAQICWYFKLTPKYFYYVVSSVKESLLIIDIIIMIFSLLFFAKVSLFMNSVQLIIFPERVKMNLLPLNMMLAESRLAKDYCY